MAGLVCGCACTQAPPETPEPIFFADVESISLGYETRHAIPVAAASSKTFRVQVPANGSLRFAIATAEPDEAVMFRALVDAIPFETTARRKYISVSIGRSTVSSFSNRCRHMVHASRNKIRRLTAELALRKLPLIEDVLRPVPSHLELRDPES